MLSRLRIGPRLAAVFALLIILMFIGSGIGLWQVTILIREIGTLSQINTQSTAGLRVYNDMLTMQSTLREIASGENTNLFLAESELLLSDLTASIAAAQEALESEIINPERAGHISEELDSIQASLTPQLAALTALAEAEDWLALRLRLDNQFSEAVGLAEHVAIKTDQSVASARMVASARLRIAQRNVFAVTIGVGAITLITAILLSIYITRTIATPLQKLDKAARAWSQGNLRYRIDIDGNDELARLGRVFNDGSIRLAHLYSNLEEMVSERTLELEQRAIQLELSRTVAQRVTSILDLDQLLTEVANLIKDRFELDYVGVFMVNESRQHIALRAGTGQHHSQVELPIGAGNHVGWVAQQRRASLINQKTDKRDFSHTRTNNIQSQLSVPLLMRDELLGVLDMQSSKINAFKSEDVPLFQSLADQVAIAIKNAAIYQGEQSQRYLAETLQQVGHALTSTLNLDKVLDLILERLQPLIPYDRGSVLLWNGRELEIKAARGFPTDFNPLDTRVPIQSADDHDVFVTIYRTKQPLLIENVNTYPSWKRVNDISVPGSWMGIPIIREGMVIGMLSLAKDEVAIYSNHDATVATAIAAQAAIALENAQLYERIKRFSEQLEYEVQKRTDALQTAYVQLEKLDRTKSSFISIASHELRTPITVLKGYSQILLKDPFIKENEYYADMLSGIRKGANRLHEIVDNMLDMAKIDGRTLRLFPEPLSVSKVVKSVINDLEEGIHDREVNLSILPQLQELPMIEADHDGIKKVLYHLIVNAIKYTPNGGHVEIDGRSWSESPPEIDWPEQGIHLIIRDNGIGIDPNNLSVIFNKFYQTGEVALHSTGKTKFKGGGPGLGLAIVKGIVTAHRGQVWAESDGYNEDTLPGSIFHVVLPLRQEANSYRLDTDNVTPRPFHAVV